MKKNAAKGSGITPELLLNAYSIGLFPMSESADDPELFWVEPDIRGIIPLEKLHVSKSLRKFMRRCPFQIKFNHDFEGTMNACAESTPDREHTWINSEIRNLYTELHQMGHAHSVEAYQNGELVGGLYGVSLKAAFFGESMFSRRSNASKTCLVHLVERLNKNNFLLLDTQFTTEHLKSMGAIDIPKDNYMTLLNAALVWPDQTFP